MIRTTALCLFLAAMPGMALAAGGFTFASIDGGDLAMEDWRGQPVLVVNTASLCGFTSQYDELQALHETYVDRGLVVLAVPSNDFSQELSSAEEVKDFCEVNFGLTLPMTDITPVRGAEAHPFYRWLAEEHGFTPRWNFNKVLIGPEGEVLGTWGSTVKPGSRQIVDQIEAALK
ncbi:MAG: glutathione peroxidase [Cypionkella sp.]|jgi:glutathione peroxidase|nr:glutathione peroxidase [Cypionkella sp.]